MVLIPNNIVVVIKLSDRLSSCKLTPAEYGGGFFVNRGKHNNADFNGGRAMYDSRGRARMRTHRGLLWPEGLEKVFIYYRD